MLASFIVCEEKTLIFINILSIGEAEPGRARPCVTLERLTSSSLLSYHSKALIGLELVNTARTISTAEGMGLRQDYTGSPKPTVQGLAVGKALDKYY